MAPDRAARIGSESPRLAHPVSAQDPMRSPGYARRWGRTGRAVVDPSNRRRERTSSRGRAAHAGLRRGGDGATPAETYRAHGLRGPAPRAVLLAVSNGPRTIGEPSAPLVDGGIRPGHPILCPR